EYFEQIEAWVSVSSDGRDPFEDCYNGGKNEVLNHVESWGYFYGFYLNYRYYSELVEKSDNNEKYERLRNDYEDCLQELWTYNNDFPEKFYSEAYYDLLTNYNYSISQIFAPYRKSEVVSLYTWKKEFYKQNSISDEEQNVINELFEDARSR
ncbi:MAG: hypothetical protein IKX23_10355, partial [Treponema sp.]|nr:hypothetical protein [Treponema sp.]